MLKGIPKIVSPQLLKVLCEMGHGDEIVIADGNFPCESMGKNAIVVRADGNSVPEILDAVLALIPLDQYYETPVALMEVVKGDTVPTPVIWKEYDALLKKHTPENMLIEYMERFAFYERAKKAYAIIATSEEAVYANILLKKGVVK
ncbi:MAG: L-fucose mutarotase [Eubacterium sp.]|nr:L-fucose mutarotase [Eubacterium sp.]